ncbi:hypothetical protein [Psychrobacter aquaticus]|uniref:hypothetical protein n=1 Tax=Psychrobacter aquaticus TaxID=248452 RepID=UPI001267E8EC|nr:hypothetical protein [Psychrobacter aquaticus]
MKILNIVDELNYSQYLIYGQSSGDSLLGFEIDANVFFCCIESNHRCDFIYQERHDDANCMLTLYCKFANNISYQQMADYLEEKWLQYVCYQEFEKHYIEVVNDQLIFYYVTRSSCGLGVTGKIVAT